MNALLAACGGLLVLTIGLGPRIMPARRNSSRARSSSLGPTDAWIAAAAGASYAASFL